MGEEYNTEHLLLEKEETPLKLLSRAYEVYSDSRVAIRRKKYGIWQSYTWKDFYENVKYLALGLVSLGMHPGDKVLLLGDNDPEYCWAYFAAAGAKGMAAAVFPDILPDEVKYYAQHSDCTFIFAQDQEQVDKVIAVKDELPLVKRVIYWEPKGLWFYTEPYLMYYEDIIRLGKDYEKGHPGVFEENVLKETTDDIVAILYTSGTTGALPKGALYTNKMFIQEAKVFNSIEQWPEDSRYISFIPLAMGIDYYLGLLPSMMLPSTVNFAEEPDTLPADTREIGPNIVVYGGRMWEQMASNIRVRMANAKGLKGVAYKLAISIGDRVGQRYLAKKGDDLFSKVMYWVAYWIGLRGLLDGQGLSKAKYAYTTGMAISPDYLRFFRGIGVELRQLYGSTEAAGVAVVHRSGDTKVETIGTPLPSTEVRVSDNGEILLRSPRLFPGYYKNPEATKKAILDGWLHTGDGGTVDSEGHLVYFGRVVEFRELSGGRRFPPEYMEIRLRFSKYIKEVVVVGGPDKDYVSALVSINYDNVGKWAENNGVVYSTYVDLCQKCEVYDLVQKEIQLVSESMPEDMRIRRFVCLHKELDADEAELTRTRKLRRGFVEEHYQDVIEALYGGKEHVTVEASVTYRDGRKGTVRTVVAVRDIVPGGH